MKIFKSKLDEKNFIRVCLKFLIKVWLQKVKQICLNPGRVSTTAIRSRRQFFNQGPVEIFSAGSAKNIFIKVWLKNKNQTLMDLRMVFNRDRDRDENFQIRV
ncbi:hypothetical protein [Methanoregula sp.]|uniref:hypothetical protein n=1 Tax=Methanoregula sp. TaxID=2052170 RepID=UPI002375EAB9|nr:hypothetical protein [Methanoregula sp.]MDD1686967.1 hypothetical protein [Methanoregula sp.]